jgi:DNA-binding transcriptional MerR regulator
MPGSEIPNPDIYGIGAASRFIGVGERTMREYADSGRIPSSRSANGDRVFKFADLMTFVQERQREAEAPSRKAIARIMRDAYKARAQSPSFKLEAAERRARQKSEQQQRDKIERLRLASLDEAAERARSMKKRRERIAKEARDGKV